MTQTIDPDLAHCWDCGYQLRGVESSACPECGRAFDRNDAASMNFGRPMGRIARRAVGRLGWLSTVLAALACGLVWSTVRWPVEGWRFAWIDLRYFARAWEWQTRTPGPSTTDACYSTGLAIGALAAAYWAFRALLRIAAVARYRPPGFQRGPFWRRSVAFIVLLAATVAGVGVGWPFRVGQRLAREWEFARRPLTPNNPPGFLIGTAAVTPAASPFVTTPADDDAIYRAALRFGDARQKTLALKWFVEDGKGIERIAILRDAARRERDPRVLAAELGVLGLLHEESAAPWIAEQLSHPDAGVRATAADALGMIYGPLELMTFRRWIDTDPPIHGVGRSLLTVSFAPPDAAPSLPPNVRTTLEHLMLEDPAPAARKAAAMTLAIVPPSKYRLRIAEWGVWIAGGGGPVVPPMAQEQIDSIPPFVHHTGDTAAQLAKQVTSGGFIVTKPVIHLTVDVPLAIDLTVMVRQGRPWFAFPRPDELPLETGYFRPNPAAGIGVLDNPKLRPLDDVRSTYPWLVPQRRTYTTFQSGKMGGAFPVYNPLLNIAGIGVRWQGLLVSPTKPAWLAPTAVPPDARFAWWPRLRDVDCSWVANAGEGDRFLYYDGPTLGATPVHPQLVKRFAGERESLTWFVDDAFAYSRDKSPGRRNALYVEVDSGGNASGSVIDDPFANGGSDSRAAAQLHGVRTAAALERALLDICRARGLTASEAAGLLACRRKPFFETEGRRFLLILSAVDYDTALPLTVRPAATETARVGIVITEFPAAKP